MRYLTAAEVIRLNERESELPGEIRDQNRLEAAVERPRQSAGGEDAFPDVFSKAAALMHAIAEGQPFRQGNKRTAFLAGYVFLARNGWVLVADQLDVVHLMVDVAIEHYGVPEIAEHLQKWCFPIPDEAD